MPLIPASAECFAADRCRPHPGISTEVGEIRTTLCAGRQFSPSPAMKNIFTLGKKSFLRFSGLIREAEKFQGNRGVVSPQLGG